MPRFYFHLETGEAKLKDEEGVALPDAEAAWYQAVRSARDLIRADLCLGSSWQGRRMEIEDEQGSSVDHLLFEDVASFAF